MQISKITNNKKMYRIIIIVLALAGTVYFSFVFIWYFAHTISSQTQYTDLAESLAAISPDDPQTHFAAAVLLEKTFLREDLQKSLVEYQKTASLTPENYIVWINLGKAYERDGNQELAEKSFRKAEQLAPHYAEIKWAVGNYLLRNGKRDEGLNKIKIAAETREYFIKPYFSLLWQNLEGDVQKSTAVIGDSPVLKSAFSVFLANEKRFDQSFEMWNSLPENERQTTFKSDGESIYALFISDKRFLQALEIKSQIEQQKDYQIGKITNGSFENDIRAKNNGLFEWLILDGFHPQIGIDDKEKISGSKSLVFIFNSDDGKEFRSLSQIVAVQPGQKYELQFGYKSNIKTNSTVKFEILNAYDGTVITSTEPIKTVSDWIMQKISFQVPQNTQGITIRLIRDSCPSSICPISGKVWFDDFSLVSK